MEVKQIYNFVNDATSEILGDSAILSEDLTNIVDIGTAIFNANAVEITEYTGHPYVVRSSTNNGIRGYINGKQIATTDISIDMHTLQKQINDLTSRIEYLESIIENAGLGSY